MKVIKYQTEYKCVNCGEIMGALEWVGSVEGWCEKCSRKREWQWANERWKERHSCEARK